MAISKKEFFEKVKKTNACWLWIGCINRNGYGQWKQKLVHRVSYEFSKGKNLKGLSLDHLCRVRHCVNPDHLEIVSRGENVLRGIGPAAINARKTHCKRGHKFTKKNTGIQKNPNGRVSRFCITCQKWHTKINNKKIYC